MHECYKNSPVGNKAENDLRNQNEEYHTNRLSGFIPSIPGVGNGTKAPSRVEMVDITRTTHTKEKCTETSCFLSLFLFLQQFLLSSQSLQRCRF